MFKFVAVICFALFAHRMVMLPLSTQEDLTIINPVPELVDVEMIEGDYLGEPEDELLTEDMINKLIEDNRIVDIDRAVDNGTLKVSSDSVEYDTGDKLLHVSRKNSKTLMKVHIDPSLTSSDTNAALHTNIDGIDQEVEMSHGLKKTIARFHAAHLGTMPNKQRIGIQQLESTTIITEKKMQPGEKAISIKYYKGLAFHRPDGSSMRKHTLRVALRPKLLDKQHSRINVTIGDFIEGRQYMSVAGVEFLYRDDSARYERCKAMPERCNITYTTTRKRVKIQSPPIRVGGRG